ncbi:MAG TPA: HEPN domain-containing protein [Proteobacteria bacterium]|nr:HEPN domain-containing protein [Pseudomonadota bacterium]
MTNNKRRMIEGWIDKAWNQLQTAKEHSKSYTQYSEAIQAAQECIELSVKSILLFLDIPFPRSHRWEQDSKEFTAIAEQIQKKQLIDKLTAQYLNLTINLPRLLFLVNFWAQFYNTAKYGFEAGYLAPAKDLFKKEETELAVQHAQECHQAASHLRSIGEDKMAALLSFEVMNANARQD